MKLKVCQTNFYITATLALFSCLAGFAQPSLTYKRLITGLSAPLEMASAPDGSKRVFVVQKVGSIKVFDSTYKFLADFVTVSGVTINGERGLLSMAFHPDYKTNGLFFVYYTNTQGDIEISRYKVSSDPNKADTTTRLIIISIPHRVAANHNGGRISFGPDGYLYFATGDGGNGGDPPNNAQNGKVLLGKMLRIDVNRATPPLNYAIPPDNPFVNDSTIADEIWAMGLRNPFRWSFDRKTYDMWIADVGQGVKEEINFRPANATKGINYGWRCYEGKSNYNLNGCKSPEVYTPPIFDYLHNLTTGGSSVTGGYVYRGKQFPALNGHYLFADYISNNQWLIYDSSQVWVMKQQTGTFPRNIAGFGEDEEGSLYACSLTEGAVYKIEVVTGVQASMIDLRGVASFGVVQLRWRYSEQNIQHYEVEGSIDSIRFVKEGTVAAKNLVTDNIYMFTSHMRGSQKKFYRLRIINKAGKWDYSPTVTVMNTSTLGNFIYPNIIRTKIISLNIGEGYENLVVVGADGSIAFNRSIRGSKGRVEIPVATMRRGLYLVRITGKQGARVQWIYVD